MGVFSLILGIVGAVVVLLGLIPSVRFFNWIGGIIALVGVVIGIIGAGQAEKKAVSVVGRLLPTAGSTFLGWVRSACAGRREQDGLQLSLWNRNRKLSCPRTCFWK